MQILKYWKPAIIAVVILYASITPANNLSKVDLFNIQHIDKIIHLVLYFVLSVTLYASLQRNRYSKNSQNIVLTLFITILYGLLMESFQYLFTTDRSPEIFDALANTIGSVLGISVFPLLRKYKISKYL